MWECSHHLDVSRTHPQSMAARSKRRWSGWLDRGFNSLPCTRRSRSAAVGSTRPLEKGSRSTVRPDRSVSSRCAYWSGRRRWRRSSSTARRAPTCEAWRSISVGRSGQARISPTWSAFDRGRSRLCEAWTLTELAALVEEGRDVLEASWPWIALHPDSALADEAAIPRRGWSASDGPRPCGGRGQAGFAGHAACARLRCRGRWLGVVGATRSGRSGGRSRSAHERRLAGGIGRAARG